MSIVENGDTVNYDRGGVPSTAEVVVIHTPADSSILVSSAPLSSGTDRSGSIATGGTAQSLAAANASRTGLKGQNISSGDLWINEIGGTAAADTAGSWKVPAGSSFSISTSRSISIVGATTGQKFTATEF